MGNTETAEGTSGVPGGGAGNTAYTANTDLGEGDNNALQMGNTETAEGTSGVPGGGAGNTALTRALTANADFGEGDNKALQMGNAESAEGTSGVPVGGNVDAGNTAYTADTETGNAESAEGTKDVPCGNDVNAGNTTCTANTDVISTDQNKVDGSNFADAVLYNNSCGLLPHDVPRPSSLAASNPPYQDDQNYLLQKSIFKPILKSLSQVSRLVDQGCRGGKHGWEI